MNASARFDQVLVDLFAGFIHVTNRVVERVTKVLSALSEPTTIILPGSNVVTVPEPVVGRCVLGVLVCANAKGAISAQAKPLIVFFTMNTSPFCVDVLPTGFVVQDPVNGQAVARSTL